MKTYEKKISNRLMEIASPTSANPKSWVKMQNSIKKLHTQADAMSEILKQVQIALDARDNRYKN